MTHQRQKRLEEALSEIEVTSYSQAKRLSIKLFGPNARVWYKGRPAVEIGVQLADGGRIVHGTGENFTEAILNAVKAYGFKDYIHSPVEYREEHGNG